MAYIAIVERDDLYKVLLHERPEGVYVYVFEKPGKYPQKDYLQDTVEMAMLFSEEDLDVPRDLWQKAPDDPNLVQ